MSPKPTPERDALLHKANSVRADLLHHIDLLERRRRVALDVPRQIRRHFRGAVVVAGLGVLLLSAGVAFAVHGVVTRHQRRRAKRLDALLTVWRRPDLVVRAKRTLWTSLRGAVLSGLASAAIAGFKWGAERLIQFKPRLLESNERPRRVHESPWRHDDFVSGRTA